MEKKPNSIEIDEKTLLKMKAYRQDSYNIFQRSNFLKMCWIMIVSIDFTLLLPISKMPRFHLDSGSVSMQLGAKNVNTIRRKALFDMKKVEKVFLFLSYCILLPQHYIQAYNNHVAEIYSVLEVWPFCPCKPTLIPLYQHRKVATFLWL